MLTPEQLAEFRKRIPNLPAVDSEWRARIVEHPDDDELRLVYADWLIERGDPTGELEGGALTNLRELELVRQAIDSSTALVAWPGLRQLERLVLRAGSLDAAAVVELAGAPLDRLVHLDLAFNRLGIRAARACDRRACPRCAGSSSAAPSPNASSAWFASSPIAKTSQKIAVARSRCQFRFAVPCSPPAVAESMPVRLGLDGTIRRRRAIDRPAARAMATHGLPATNREARTEQREARTGACDFWTGSKTSQKLVPRPRA